MPPTIIVLTPEEIEQRRRDLLAASGLDHETLRERGANFMLSPEQAAILNELENLEFLAGE